MFNTARTGDETYTGTVTSVDDPEKRGRVRVTCYALLGDETMELPTWVESNVPMGWFLIPEVGRQVTISISSGSSTDLFAGQSSINSAAPRWTGVVYSTGEGDSPVANEFVTTNYGKRRGFKTPRGHVFLFDDTQGEEQVTISWSGGTKAEPKTSLLSLNGEGSFVAQDAQGSVFYMNGGNGETSIVNQSGAYMILSGDGISLVDSHSNGIVMNDSGINFMSQGPIGFAGTDHTFSNGLHFVDEAIPNAPVGVNVGGLAASLHALTTSGIAMTSTTALNVAVLGVSTWQAQLAALNITAAL